MIFGYSQMYKRKLKERKCYFNHAERLNLSCWLHGQRSGAEGDPSVQGQKIERKRKSKQKESKRQEERRGKP